MTRKTYTILGLIPLIVFIALAGMLINRLENPRAGGSIDSPLIGKPMPPLGVPLYSRPVIVNVFASWCAPCAVEHPFLMAAKKDGMHIIGIAYKDTADNIADYLKRHGNPYDMLVFDPKGSLGIQLGITGVPESFAVDALGIVRKRLQGPFADSDSLARFGAP